jgi:uncharacterized protein
MKCRIKGGLLYLLAVLVTIFALFNVLASRHAHSMLHFTAAGARTLKPESLSFWTKARLLFVGVNVPRPESTLAPTVLAPRCRALSITGPDAVTLAAWYCDRGPETPLAIMFHGYTAEKSSLLGEAQGLLDLGMSVLLVDFRGSGGASESYTTIGVHEADDVVAAVAYAENRFSHTGTVLFGQSMGAVAILRAVHEGRVLPDAVIFEAVFDTMLNTVRNRFSVMNAPSFPAAELLIFWGGRQLGFDGFSHNPLDYAESLNCPALFLHGTDDPRAKLSEGRRVFAAAPQPKRFKIFASAGHESYVSVSPDEWKDSIRSFSEACGHFKR